jgi:chemotaxis family two-component system sensor kinase Cph1
MAEKKNFDSKFCGSLPLHNINLIQDYGYLLVAELESLNIIQASENSNDITGITVKEMIGTNLSKYISFDYIVKIKGLIDKGLKNRIPLDLSFKYNEGLLVYHALLHIKSEYILIELEKADLTVNRSFTTVFQEVKYVIAAIEEADSVQKVCDVAIHELRKISGFDGILMYQFDHDWNGTVIAEEKDERLEKYIGQTFPASDVPKQARELYLKNPYRLIPNRSYTPVRLYPVINPLTSAFINLSDCNLRSVAAVHLEYMANMNIKSSMSIRVLYNESLWGLISCHHLDEKYLNYEICSVFEWLSTVISNRITLILNKEKFDFTKDLQERRLAISDLIYAENDIMALMKRDDILDLFKATGAVLLLNGKIESIGQVPERGELDNLMFWLEGKCIDQVFSSHHLSGVYEDATSFCKVGSGILVIPIDSNKGEYLICFRPELIEDIHWGGDPNQAIQFDPDQKNYHPRNSFKLWKQTVFKHARPWHQQEIEIASSLRNFLFEFRTRQLYN